MTQTRRHRLLGVSAAGAILAMIALGGAPVESQAQGAAQGGPQAVPNEVLIQFRADASEAAKANARSRAQASHDDLIAAQSHRLDGKGDLELAKLPPGISVAAAVRKLQSDPTVEFAEPNWIYYHEATSNDPYYTDGSLWGMYGDATSPANQYGSQAGEAWAAGHTGSNTVYVGVIDEGIQLAFGASRRTPDTGVASTRGRCRG